MNVSDKGRDFIKKFEGCVLHAYRDSGGIWTIGYGHTHGVSPGMVWTQEKADHMFSATLIPFENVVERETAGLELKQHQFDMLVSLCYNIGPGWFRKSRLLKALKAGDKDASQYFLTIGTRDARGVRLRGLVRRRESERKIFEQGY